MHSWKCKTFHLYARTPLIQRLLSCLGSASSTECMYPSREDGVGTSRESSPLETRPEGAPKQGQGHPNKRYQRENAASRLLNKERATEDAVRQRETARRKTILFCSASQKPDENSLFTAQNYFKLTSLVEFILISRIFIKIFIHGTSFFN